MFQLLLKDCRYDLQLAITFVCASDLNVEKITFKKALNHYSHVDLLLVIYYILTCLR